MHGMKPYGGVGVQLLSFLNSGLGGLVVSLKPRLLYPRGKSLRYPFQRRLSESQSCSGRFEEGINLLSLP